jgi:hypothetical protein
MGWGKGGLAEDGGEKVETESKVVTDLQGDVQQALQEFREGRETYLGPSDARCDRFEVEEWGRTMKRRRRARKGQGCSQKSSESSEYSSRAPRGPARTGERPR